MKAKSHRRSFLKQGAVLGGGLMLLGRQAQTTRAAESETEPATGPAIPNRPSGKPRCSGS